MVRNMNAPLTGKTPTPFGDVWLLWDDSGVRAMCFDDPTPGSAWGKAQRLDQRATELLARLLSEPPRYIESLSLGGTAFQRRVWQALLEIPLGTVTSYRQLAEHIGRPTAVRAVANAVGANPVAWLIPCHRVIRSDGGLGGYRWGVERKRALLAWERDKVDQAA